MPGNYTRETPTPSSCRSYGFGAWVDIWIRSRATCGNGSYFKEISKTANSYAGSTWDAAFKDCDTVLDNGATECECFVFPDGRWFDVRTAPFMDTGIYAEASIMTGNSICSASPVTTVYGVTTCDGSRQEIGHQPSPNAWCNQYNRYSSSAYMAGVGSSGTR